MLYSHVNDVLIVDQNSNIVICGNFLLEMLNWRWGPSSAYAEELAYQSFRSWFRIWGEIRFAGPSHRQQQITELLCRGVTCIWPLFEAGLLFLIRCWNGFLNQGSSRHNHCLDSSAGCTLFWWALWASTLTIFCLVSSLLVGAFTWAYSRSSCVSI